MAGKVFGPAPGEDTALVGERKASTGTSSWQRWVGILGLVVVSWVGSEMYGIFVVDDFGPGAGGDAPAVNQDPDGGGGHRPGPPAGGH